MVGYEKRDHNYGAFSEFSFLNVYNLESIAATDLNFGTIILSSSYYTRKKFQAPLISGVGEARAHIDRIRKLPFYASLWQLTARDRRLALASNVGSVK